MMIASDSMVRIYPPKNLSLVEKNDNFIILVRVSDSKYRVVESWPTKAWAERALASLQLGSGASYLIVDKRYVPLP